MKYILVILILCSITISCNQNSSYRFPSPNSKYYIEVFKNQDLSDERRKFCAILVLKDPESVSVDSIVTGASMFQNWDLKWVSDHKFIFESSDIGNDTILISNHGKFDVLRNNSQLQYK